ncbi:MAG: toprim domain-containing protein [Sediminibacterium sp.]
MYKRDRQKHSYSVSHYSPNQVKKVLIASGVTITAELDNDLMLFCPFHNNYRSPAAEISKDTGLFWCFSCQETKTLEEVVMHVTQRSYFEAARLIDSKSESIDLLDNLSEALNKAPEFVEYDLEVINRLHNNVFKNKRAQEYFEKRGITKDSVIKYKLGYSENQDMVTIPVHSSEGLCLGFVGRSVEGKIFKNSTNLPKSKTMFNIHRAKLYDKVFVVESSFDAIRLEQVGAHAVAALGATISKEQRKLLKQYFNQVIVLGDNDEAGKNMSNKIKESFGSGCLVSSLPSMVKDVSDMKEDDLRIFVETFDEIVMSVLK